MNLSGENVPADRSTLTGKVLVTGASGLLGAELVNQLLSKGNKVKAIFNQTPLPDFKSENFEQVQCDILDVVILEEIMQDVTEVYHCAGYVNFSPRSRNKLFKINVEGTSNIVNASLNAGVRKLVHVSSVAALGRIRENESITEKMQWTPETSNSIYGHSKYLGEMEVWRGIAEGLDAVIVNPVVILGPGNWEDGSTGIFKSAYEEFPWYAEGTTGFVDVRDVARAMILLMESPVVAERFIISGINTSYREVFNQIADAFGKKRPTKKVTPGMAGLIWRFEKIKSMFTGKDPLVTKETATTALAHVQFDNGKLFRSIPGFSYTDLKQTIQYTVHSLQQKLNIP